MRDGTESRQSTGAQCGPLPIYRVTQEVPGTIRHGIYDDKFATSSGTMTGLELV